MNRESEINCVSLRASLRAQVTSVFRFSLPPHYIMHIHWTRQSGADYKAGAQKNSIIIQGTRRVQSPVATCLMLLVRIAEEHISS